MVLIELFDMVVMIVVLFHYVLEDKDALNHAIFGIESCPCKYS
jgi:hypothetical protein